MTDPHAIVERLLATLPGPRMTATMRPAPERWIDIDLDGPELPLSRMLAVSALADAIGDNDGPTRTPNGRYTIGTFEGIGIVVTTASSPTEHADIARYAELYCGA